MQVLSAHRSLYGLSCCAGPRVFRGCKACRREGMLAFGERGEPKAFKRALIDEFGVSIGYSCTVATPTR